MTVKEIEGLARTVLLDDVAPYRWSASFIRSALQDAVRFLHSIRPSTRYVGGAFAGEVSLPESDDEMFHVEDKYREALAAYVAHKCLEMDSNDTQNLALSESYLSKAKTLMQL